MDNTFLWWDCEIRKVIQCDFAGSIGWSFNGGGQADAVWWAPQCSWDSSSIRQRSRILPWAVGFGPSLTPNLSSLISVGERGLEKWRIWKPHIASSCNLPQSAFLPHVRFCLLLPRLPLITTLELFQVPRGTKVDSVPKILTSRSSGRVADRNRVTYQALSAPKMKSSYNSLRVIPTKRIWSLGHWVVSSSWTYIFFYAAVYK